MARDVLILIGDPNFNYNDEKSAVLSYLLSIKEAFERNADRPEFAPNQQGDQSTYSDRSKFGSGSSGILAALKSLLKRWPWLYQSVVMTRYFKAQEALFRKISEGKKYEQVIEYHILGSEMGSRLSRQWGAEFSVIFDSPSPEQFERIHGTKSAHWKRIIKAEKRTMEAASRIMCYSPACQEYLEKQYDLKATINVLPSQLHKNVKVDRKTTDTFNIGFIGSFLSWHKLDLMVRVFEKFQLKNPDARLMLIGYGQQWSNIKKLVDQLQLNDVVDMPGFVSEEQLTDYKSRFTIAVMPGSNWYGSPLKLFEYAQLGIPFIAPVSKTVSSIFIDEEHCIYVKEEDEEGTLYEAMERYYGDENLRDRLGEQARSYLKMEFAKDVYQRKLVSYLS